MPATTRSKTKQSHLEDFGTTETKSASKTNKGSNTNTQKESTASSKKPEPKSRPSTKDETKKIASTKRKQAEPDADDPPKDSTSAKKQKQQHATKSGDDSKPIMINRSPVLQLWSACVAQHLHPDQPWTTSLSVGSAISTLCAISKGRSIGTIEESDKSPDEKAEKDAGKRAANAGADIEFQVMGFKLHVKNGDVLLQGKPKRGNEAPLKSKFGEDNYDKTKKIMEDALATWKGKDDDLNAKAFHMYEEFRPSVQSGQGGWGKKGALELDRVKEVVERG
ncbi:hypothetical protein LTR10_022806 [Elasticomyces elasticus]|uniref:Uncharacterized protein n=1 Tax=Exophiala sideris TaxID=1016849 RepID=A0ABR0JHE8_9EURO|nr:hypothetical protein LTR10_022806 [Elasticomyces elasticus]KAK5033592.1 hypothetical protein LTS07_003897 [Exophiala sideris]KAK5041913.1 hypothetical protein LTR13_001718 [Exophiala sideris]KAK5064136.1 hypothetical protein LTR69_003905 [Exophiala sideris]KAK5185181.1 hypothetical protein LTR44_002169 [Eurotiomycetes sp. CCFEE 6388]